MEYQLQLKVVKKYLYNFYFTKNVKNLSENEMKTTPIININSIYNSYKTLRIAFLFCTKNTN